MDYARVKSCLSCDVHLAEDAIRLAHRAFTSDLRSHDYARSDNNACFLNQSSDGKQGKLALISGVCI